VNYSLLSVYPVVRSERAASIRSALFLEILLDDGEHHFRNHLNAHIPICRFMTWRPVRLRDSDVARLLRARRSTKNGAIVHSYAPAFRAHLHSSVNQRPRGPALRDKK
jgi:hypothetical protein